MLEMLVLAVLGLSIAMFFSIITFRWIAVIIELGLLVGIVGLSMLALFGLSFLFGGNDLRLLISSLFGVGQAGALAIGIGIGLVVTLLGAGLVMLGIYLPNKNELRKN